MTRVAFVFPGQGCQTPGMGMDFYRSRKLCRDILAQGSEVLGFSLEKACFKMNEQELADTKIAQPAIVAVSIMALTLLQDAGIRADSMAGHSLGEYSALFANGVLGTEEFFYVIRERAKLMEEAAQMIDGTMCAIFKAPAEKIEEICKEVSETEHKGLVLPVNYNTPEQTVISGARAAVMEAAERLKPFARRCVPLNVQGAFHTPYMLPAANEFFFRIANTTFFPPYMPIYSNYYRYPMDDRENMPTYLKQHMVSPVYFVEEIQMMHEDGIRIFIELGPGQTICNMIKKILPNVQTFCLRNLDDLKVILRHVRT